MFRTAQPKRATSRPFFVLAPALPLALLLLAFALRVYRLGDQNVWWDEGLAIWAVRMPLRATTLWTAGDVHPPLFFWTLWPWVRLVGQGEFAARFLTVCWSILTCALGFALGRRLGGRPAGLLALAFLAVARFPVWWAMELRMYALAGLAVLAAVYGLVRWAGAGWRGGWLGFYAAAAVAALYTVYLTGVALIALNLAVLAAVLLRRVPRSAVLRWSLAQVGILVLLVPWLAVALPRMKSWSATGTPASIDFVGQLWATLLMTGVSTDIEKVRGWVVVGAGCVVLAALWIGVNWARQGRFGRRGEPLARRSTRFLAGLGTPHLVAGIALVLFRILPPLAVWAATQPRALFYSPNVEARYFLPFAAPVYVLVGWMLARVLRASRPTGLLLSTVFLGVLAVNLPGHYAERRFQDTFASMVVSIFSQAEPGDAVVLVSGNRYPLFRYAYDAPWDNARSLPLTGSRTGSPSSTAAFNTSGDFPVDRPPRWEERPELIEFPDKGTDPVGKHDWEKPLAAIADAHPRVWLAEVDRALQDPDGKVQAWLNDHRTRVLSEGYGPNALHLYTTNGQTPRITGWTGRWRGMVRLEGPIGWLNSFVAMPARRLRPGDEWGLTVFSPGVAASPEAQEVPSIRIEPWQLRAELTTQRTRVRIPIDRHAIGQEGTVRLAMASDLAGLPDLEWTAGSVQVSGVPPRLPAPESLAGADFGLARLDRFAASARRLRAGERLFLDLYWSVSADATEPPDPSPVVFAHLIGPPNPATGNPVWSADDGPPPGGTWADLSQTPELLDRRFFEVPPDAPAGRYQIEVGLYLPASGERLPVQGASADAANRRVILTSVEVTR